MSVAPVAVVTVAMDEEAQPFLALAEARAEVATGAHAARWDLVIAGRTVTLLRSGIGFANAVAAAAYARYTFGAAVPLISAGSAGGLAAGVQVGEVVVAERTVNVNADATAFGYALGQVPGMPADYPADAALLAASESEHIGITVRRGVIGSGEAFVTSERALGLRRDFPAALAVDMESAALAQFAHTHGQPFVSVRGISDLCAPDGTEFLTHVDDAAERSAAVVAALIAALATIEA